MMSKPSYKSLSDKHYQNSEQSEKTKDLNSLDQSRSKFSSSLTETVGDQLPLTTPYQELFDCTIQNYFWLDKMGRGDGSQENFICVTTQHTDGEDLQIIQLELNQDYSLSVEALLLQFPKATGLYYYNHDNALCGVPQNQEKLFPPSSGNQTFYFTELGCSCRGWVEDLKIEINQLNLLKNRVDLLEEETKASKVIYNNSISQMKSEIQDLRIEIKQAKEIHLKEMSMLQQKYKMMQLEGNKETSTSKNQLKQETLNRKEQIKKEMSPVQTTLNEIKEEIINLKEEMGEIKINNQDVINTVDYTKVLKLHPESDRDIITLSSLVREKQTSDSVIEESKTNETLNGNHTCSTHCSCMTVLHGYRSKAVEDELKVNGNKGSNIVNLKTSWVPLEERSKVGLSADKLRSTESKLSISDDKNFVQSFRPKLAKNSAYDNQQQDKNGSLSIQSRVNSKLNLTVPLAKSTKSEKQFYGMKRSIKSISKKSY